LSEDRPTDVLSFFLNQSVLATVCEYNLNHKHQTICLLTTNISTSRFAYKFASSLKHYGKGIGNLIRNVITVQLEDIDARF